MPSRYSLVQKYILQNRSKAFACLNIAAQPCNGYNGIVVGGILPFHVDDSGVVCLFNRISLELTQKQKHNTAT